MDCLACGLKSGYNRVAVDVPTGRELGGLCFRCEERQFGRSLKEGLWTECDGCVLCSRDGLVALPEWRPRTSDADGVLRLENDYELDAATVELCDEHFDRLESRSLDPHRADGTGDTRHVR